MMTNTSSTTTTTTTSMTDNGSIGAAAAAAEDDAGPLELRVVGERGLSCSRPKSNVSLWRVLGRRIPRAELVFFCFYLKPKLHYTHTSWQTD